MVESTPNPSAVGPISQPSTTPTQPPIVNTPPSSSHHRSSLFYLIPLMLFVIGIIGGYIYAELFPGIAPLRSTETQSQSTKQYSEISLPPEAVLIQECSDHRGALYVKPEDIPVGPVYMVHNGKVIGIEYMLSQEEFLSGKSYKNLPAHNISIDHVNTGLISKGHAGYPAPHYHVDLYTVTKEVEDSIVCPTSAVPMQNMPGVNQNTGATASPEGAINKLTTTPEATLSPISNIKSSPSAVSP